MNLNLDQLSELEHPLQQLHHCVNVIKHVGELQYWAQHHPESCHHQPQLCGLIVTIDDTRSHVDISPPSRSTHAVARIWSWCRPKKEDWLKKKDRNQRRPGCGRKKVEATGWAPALGPSGSLCQSRWAPVLGPALTVHCHSLSSWDSLRTGVAGCLLGPPTLTSRVSRPHHFPYTFPWSDVTEDWTPPPSSGEVCLTCHRHRHPSPEADADKRTDGSAQCTVGHDNKN